MNANQSQDAPASAPRSEREEGMGGLKKGLAIIESFTPATPRLSVSEAAAASGTSPAAARRCLRSLEELGYVSYDGKFYRPTPRMMRLPNAYAETDPLPVLAQPHLTAVREAFDESASLAVLQGDDVLFIARSESSHMASTGMRVGSRVPAPASAAGRILLAALSPDELGERLRSYRPPHLTGHSVVTVAGVRARVQHAADVGYAYTDEELELGVRAIAVPVVDVTGRTCAAMTVSALAARYTMQEMIDQFFPVLKTEAGRLGATL